MKRLFMVALLTLAFFSTTAFTNAPHAYAATRSVHPLGCSLQIVFTSYSTNGPVNRVSAYNGTSTNASLHMGNTNSISNQLSGTIGFTVGYISGQLGFQVTGTRSVSYDYTITVAPGQTGEIDAYAEYINYTIKNTCSGAEAVASDFDGNIYYDGYIS